MSKKMNLPNKLTMLRLCLVPVVMILLLLPSKWLDWRIGLAVGAALFGVTAYTDRLDGKIARAQNLITDFGKFMDPVADKFMTIGMFMVILLRMSFPDLYGVAYASWFRIFYFVAVVLVIFRELAITSLRLVLVNASGKVVAANLLGKIKTVSQIASILLLLLEPYAQLFFRKIAPEFTLFEYFPLSILLVSVMLVFTVLSGVNYIAKNFSLFAKDW